MLGGGFLGGGVVEFDCVEEGFVNALSAAEDGHDGGLRGSGGTGTRCSRRCGRRGSRRGEEAAGLVGVQAQRSLEALDEQRAYCWRCGMVL